MLCSIKQPELTYRPSIKSFVKMLKFQGCQAFRQRLVCATLSGRPIRIDDIRADDESPGLRDFEASFLRLLEKVTNGCKVEINETGALPLAETKRKTFCTAKRLLSLSLSRGAAWMYASLLHVSWLRSQPSCLAHCRHSTAVQARDDCRGYAARA